MTVAFYYDNSQYRQARSPANAQTHSNESYGQRDMQYWGRGL